MAKFRKKPVIIDAEQWNGSAHLANRVLGERYGEDWEYASDIEAALHIFTLEGTMRAEIGDWIITGVQGEVYPIKDEIFRETYESVAADETESDDS